MIEPRQLSENVSMRALRVSDAAALEAAYARNRVGLPEHGKTHNLYQVVLHG